ncbi:transcription termination/antitermination NusG family protein [Shewanella sp. NIFS-20-20]|uniref:transcription termination/antitermination NusG family protein n=1 Tax=Shewanella sp. NIFS-20-20 TaxID=2853806 RepID=UPI001C437DCD|nr:transcription termination/antitermination NusG family protein [Shewanella sp. NIFS-20-20]MBV7314823.1 transcription/translation regulatory transformer protein RfaH [Shewanella sp. NIFS-20-20]
MNAWYLLYCKTRNELRAQQHLNLQQIATYLPMLQQKTKNSRGKESIKSTPLFPGYLFARFDPEVTSVVTIKNTRGVAGIVDCREKMQPLCHLVYSIKRQERALGIIDLTDSALPVTNTAIDDEDYLPVNYSEGDRVSFIDGPFEKLEGIFQQQDDKTRCTILMEVLGRMQKVKVSTRVLTPASKPKMNSNN